MYSPEITQRRLHQAKKQGHTYTRLPRDTSIDISQKLEKLRYSDRGELIPKTPANPDGLARSLDAKEFEFVNSERLICKMDFDYYLSRYHAVELDSGVGSGESGVGPGVLLESQRRFITMIGRREKEMHEEFAKYGQTEGIKALAHKSRQQVFTSTSRAFSLHRLVFWPGTRCFAGALNPDGMGELYKRDKVTLDNLPFWLRPELYPDVKDSEIGFPAPLNSRMLYQAENQKAGIGVGTQQDVSHFTEVSLWAYPEYNIGFSFAPAIPKSRSTLHIQEATSAGKGYWKDVTEACRRKDRGYESWTYIFIPWYFNRSKFRSIPPPGWVPAAHTMEHAQLIERTSPEWNDGVKLSASVEQMAWWEAERAKYVREGQLGAFLASYPATPEMSFVNWAQGALPVELIEKMQGEVRRPGVYECEVAG